MNSTTVIRSEMKQYKSDNNNIKSDNNNNNIK